MISLADTQSWKSWLGLKTTKHYCLGDFFDLSDVHRGFREGWLGPWDNAIANGCDQTLSVHALVSREDIPKTKERGDAKGMHSEIGKIFVKVNETTNLHQEKWR